MSNFRKLAATLFLVPFLFTACAKPPSSSDSNNNLSSSAGDSKGPLPQVSPVSPGAYGSKMVNGTNMIVGRYPVGKPGGTFVRSLSGVEPKTFNPWAANDVYSSQLAGLMFAGLTGSDAFTGEVIPNMAEELIIDPDGVTYTTKLREGLKWSDGQPITAEDVAFTFNTIIKDGYGDASLKDILSVDGKFPEVIAVDKLTNKFVTPTPFAPFKRLIGMPIAPKHIVEPVIKQKDGRTAFVKLWSVNSDPKTMVINGPFRLSRYLPAQRVEFEPRPDYFMINKDGKPLPYLQKIVYQIVPNTSTALLKFKSKELDCIGLQPQDISDMLKKQDEGNYKLYNLGPSSSTPFICVNMNRRKNPKTGKPYVDPIKSAWFNDTNFRQAINHAINRKILVDNIYKGNGAPLFTALAPTSPYANKDLEPFSCDPEYALSLLTKSGFKLDKKNQLFDKAGHKVEFDMLTIAGSPMGDNGSVSIVEDLKKIGIKVNIQPIDFGVLGGKLSNSFDWQACMLGLSGGDPLEPNNGGNVFRSSGRLHMFDQRPQDDDGNAKVTDARPWEKRLDEIFDQAAVTMDETKRKALYGEYQKIVYDECPFIYLVTPLVVTAVRNDMKNYDPTPLSQLDGGFHNLEELYKAE